MRLFTAAVLLLLFATTACGDLVNRIFPPTTTFTRTLLDDSDAATARDTLGLESGLEAAETLGVDYWYNVKWYGAAGDGVTDDTTAFTSAEAAAAGIGGAVYFPPGDYEITDNVTVSSNVCLEFAPGATISVATAKTVTIDSPENVLCPPRNQCFVLNGTGKVYFSKGGVIHVGWYGAVGDGDTDDTTAIQNAFNNTNCASVYKVVQFQRGDYEFSNLTAYKGTTLQGVSSALGASTLIRKSGSTGIGIRDSQDANGGYNIWLRHLIIDGNDVDDTNDILVELGYGTNQWGVYSGMDDVRIENYPTGIGIKANTNVSFLTHVSFADCNDGMWVDGGGSFFSNLSFSDCNNHGLVLSSIGDKVSKFHGEGAFETSVIDVQSGNNMISDGYCLIGVGNTTGSVIHLTASGDYTTIEHVTAKITGTLTNNIIYDESMAGGRKVTGKQNASTDYWVVPSYTAGVGWVCSWLGATAPTTGTWVKGDYFFHSSPDPGEVRGWVCVSSGSPGTWQNFTGEVFLQDENTSPDAVGEFKYDNTITGLDDGGLVWYDDDEIRTVVDLDASEALEAGDDGYIVTYNWNSGAGYFTLSSAGAGDMLVATYDPGGDGVDGNDTAYSAAWNGDVNAPTMNSVYDIVSTLSGDMTKAVYDPGDDGVDGNDTAYGAGWNGDVNAPTMNAVYDKFVLIHAALDPIDTEAELEALIDHNDLNGVTANEHIDWTKDQGATNIEAGNIPDLSGTYEPAGVAVADITDASANGRSLISAANYAAMRTLLDLEAGTDFYAMAAADTAFEAELDNSAGLLAALSDETGTGVAVFNDSPTFADDITVHATGVKITGDGDGALTFLGLGDGFDEDMTFNLDDTENTVTISSSTGVATWTFSGISLTADLTGNVTGNVSGSSGSCTGNAATCTTASAGDAAADFFGEGVHAVTEATACTDLEGTKLSITDGTLNCTETDSVVGAVTGLVKADGGGNISVAVANTDYEPALTDESSLYSTLSDVTQFYEAGDEDTIAAAISAGALADLSVVADDLAATLDLSGKTITLPSRTANTDHQWKFNLFDPDALYAADHEICIDPNTEAAITIKKIEVTCDADPTTELDIDLCFCDAFIGQANTTVIDVIDTTNGTTNITSGFDDATIPANKCVMLRFGADPDDNITQASFKILWDYD